MNKCFWCNTPLDPVWVCGGCRIAWHPTQYHNPVIRERLVTVLELARPVITDPAFAAGVARRVS